MELFESILRVVTVILRLFYLTCRAALINDLIGFAFHIVTHFKGEVLQHLVGRLVYPL